MLAPLRRILLAAAIMAGGHPAAAAAPVSITVKGDRANPPSPRMGDRLVFHSALRNTGGAGIEGSVAWLTLLRVDPGQEQPVDLEDWSATKSASVLALQPDQLAGFDWSLRLIEAGDYRIFISVLVPGDERPTVSAGLPLHVRERPVLESARVLPVAAGVPAVLGVALLWRLRQRRRPPR